MNTNLKLVAVAVITLLLGIFINSHTMTKASVSGTNVAVVDINQVVESSAKAQALKAEQKKKFEELVTFVGKARTELEKETDPAKVKSIEKKYQDEFETKRAAIEKDYEAKLVQINNDINKTIETVVQEKNYDMVFVKSAVLSGGTDITNDVKQKVQ